jgi:hypothetical protein
MTAAVQLSVLRMKMKKLIVALTALFAVTLLSGNAFAFTATPAKGLHASNAVVKVASLTYYRPTRHYYRTRSYCGCYRPTCYTGCGCNGGGWGLGGLPIFGWFF